MKRFLCLSALVVLIASFVLLRDRASGQTPATAAPAPHRADPNRAMLNTYCVGCHNARLKTGGLVLEGLSTQQVAADAAVGEKVLKKLRGRLMPPPGLPQPPQKDIDAFAAYMENALDSQTRGPKAGYVPIQRLNRTEYAASVKALIGVEVDEKEILPQDVQIEGFDNIAEALRTSPAFLDQYLTAARHMAKAGVGNMAPPIASVTFQTEGNQDPALPFPAGMRGGVKFTHSVPADGEYRFSFFDLDIGLYNRQMQNRTTLVLLVDGKPVFKGDLGGEHDLWLANVKGTDGWQQILDRFQKIPVKLLAGEHEIMAGYIQRSHLESDDNVGAGGGVGGAVPMSGFRRGIDILEIKGPYNPTGITNSPTRPMIFICDPKEIGELPCARKIAQNLAHRAYSRPVTEADMAYLMRFYNEGRLDNQPFDSGVEEIVAGVLASPDFLYRSIRGVQDRRQNRRVCAYGPGTGQAPLLLPLEYASRCRAAQARRIERPDETRRPERASEAHARGSEGLEPRIRIRHEVAQSQHPRLGTAGSENLSGLQRHTARRLPEGSGAVFEQHSAGRQERAGSADLGSDVHEQPARPSLRHRRTGRAHRRSKRSR